jgi:hypothetical protein
MNSELLRKTRAIDVDLFPEEKRLLQQLALKANAAVTGVIAAPPNLEAFLHRIVTDHLKASLPKRSEVQSKV